MNLKNNQTSTITSTKKKNALKDTDKQEMTVNDRQVLVF